MSKIRELIIEELQKQSMEEGNFGKFLGGIATAAALSMGGINSSDAKPLSDLSNIQPENIMRSKMNIDTPAWVQNAKDGGIIEQNGKYYYISGIERDKNSNNTAQLEREAGLDAGVSIIKSLNNAINNNLDSTAKKVSGSYNISSMIPKGSFWQMGENDNGDVVYQAFSKVQIDKDKLIDSMVQKIHQTNPQMSKQQIQNVITASLKSLGL